MKKNTVQKIVLAMVVLTACVTLSFTTAAVWHHPTEKKVVAKVATPPGPGIPRAAVAGNDYYSGGYVTMHCGDAVFAFVTNSTDWIATGTHLYADSHLVNPWPDGILVSNSGTTTGNSYWVIGGVVMGYATPC